jgi:hypothetical protein
MKKLLVLFMVFFIVIPVFAQDNDQVANGKDGGKDGQWRAITINPTPIVLGIFSEGIGFNIGFENAFFLFFSVKLDSYIVILRPDTIYDNAISQNDNMLVSFRFALEARWYPLGGAVEGLFTNVGFQYQQTLGTFYFSEGFETTPFRGNKALGPFLGAGYKFVLGRGRVAFVIEPAADVIWSFHFGERANYYGNWRLGMNGFRISTNFGVAF